MSESCCEVPEPTEDGGQRKAIVIVLFINLFFFFGEGIAGILSQSSSLLADAVDMGGDALVYFLSLLALNRSLRLKSKVALFSSGFEFILGLGVLVEVISKLNRDIQPVSTTMLVVGFLALLANLTSGFLLLSHRDKDINMKAVWNCTRNDILNNFFTLVAGGCVYFFNSKWPDIIGGFLIAGLIVFFSSRVLIESLRHLRQSNSNIP